MDTTGILVRIRKIVRSINLESKKIQKLYGISIPQILCLGFLQRADNYQATQGEVAAFLNLNQSTVNGIIRRLEAKGYIARLPKSGDKRMVHIALTSAGDRLLSKVPPLLHDRLSTKLDGMEETQLQKIEMSLDILINMLDIQDVEASPVITNDLELN